MRIATMVADPKVAYGVSGTTATTGIADWLNWIPDDIGKLATLVGIVLSLVLIGNHAARGIMAIRKHRAEMRILNGTGKAPLKES